MSKYKGLFTFDADNHRYVPVEQADGIISDMNYHPEPEEEPKDFWLINIIGIVEYVHDLRKKEVEMIKEIGNYFSSEEEAEKAVEKLKAWKRLKDNGFKFDGWKRDDRYCGDFTITATDQTSCDDKDLDLLFSGEDD